MCWVAFDRAIAIAESDERRSTVRSTLARDSRRDPRAGVRHAFNAEIGAFTQTYDSADLDAAVLMIPLVGFLPPTIHASLSTIEAIDA